MKTLFIIFIVALIIRAFVYLVKAFFCDMHTIFKIGEFFNAISCAFVAAFLIKYMTSILNFIAKVYK